MYRIRLVVLIFAMATAMHAVPTEAAAKKYTYCKSFSMKSKRAKASSIAQGMAVRSACLGAAYGHISQLVRKNKSGPLGRHFFHALNSCFKRRGWTLKTKKGSEGDWICIPVQYR